jgi:APA family basic amino acid/polyamine antiporter
VKSNFLFSKKPIAEMMAGDSSIEHPPRKVLGPFHLTALGVGAIIGAGIFVLTGQAAAQYAGPAVVISFLISGMASAFAGLCYAEFASIIAIAGSAYTYAYATLGELLAWIIGWDLILEYLFGASTVAVGWSGYVESFLKDFGILIPEHLSGAPFSHTIEKGWQFTGAVMNLPAIYFFYSRRHSALRQQARDLLGIPEGE